MESGGLRCNGCGSSHVVFIKKTRILSCNQCGRDEHYSRATLNANQKVLFSKENAMNFFAEGRFDNAYHYAKEVLNISKDNAPALFIMAYYDGFVIRKDGSINSFIQDIKNLALEYNEVRELIKLLLLSAYNIIEYEEDILRLIIANMQSEEDSEELCEFVDKLCPYFISRRPSMNFLTKGQIEVYREIAAHCDIPKTCFALLKEIEENPDSPYVDNSFYLTYKAKCFYENFILSIEDIIYSIKTKELRDKFINVYNNKKIKYEKDAKLI